MIVVMSTVIGTCAAGSSPGSVQRLSKGLASPALLRSIFVITCLASALVAASLGEPASLVRADPQLAMLLRGMALIKSAMVLAAIAVLFWRFGHPVRAGIAVAYTSGVGVLVAASMLIWQLSYIPFAALAFHVAAFIVLVAAWRDGGTKFKFLRRAGSPFDRATSQGCAPDARKSSIASRQRPVA